MVEQPHNQPMSEPARPMRTGRSLTIDISARTIGIIFTIFATLWVFHEIPETLLIVSMGVLLATVVDRPAAWLADRKVPRGIGILLVLLLLVGSVAAVAAVLEPIIVREYGTIESSLKDYQSQATHSLNVRGIHVKSMNVQRLTNWLSSNMSSVADSAASISLSVGHAAVALFATVVLAYMLAASPSMWMQFMARFLGPRSYARATDIANDVHRRITGWAKGQFLVAASFGILFGVALWIARVPYAASLGLTAGVLEVIPYLGGIITLILASIIALTISLPHVIAVVVIYTILINIESHILAPKLIGSAVGLPPAAVLVALLIGLEVKGVVGVLLAVPVALIVAAVLDEFWPANAVDPKTGTPVKADPSQQVSAAPSAHV